jgi:hypothetical protein
VIKRVAIFGDSWAYGSFKKMPNMQETPNAMNFQSLFAEKNIHVDNYAVCGGTNLDSLELSKKHHNYDLLIIFQTDPIRQCLKDNTNLSVIDDLVLPQATDFNDLCELLLKEFYWELEKIDSPKLLIGGCTKLCFDHIPKSINTLPQSWTEMVAPGFNDNYYYWTEPTLCLYNYARKKFNWPVSLADFFEFEQVIKNKNYIWQTSDNFSWCHADEPAYKVMFERIMEIINDNYS